MYKVTMPYIGAILSSNFYKFSSRGTKPVVRIWMNELADKVKGLGIPKCNRYEIRIFGRFWDERRPDLSNLHKVIGDSIEKGLGVNDKNFLFRDVGYEVGKFDPELEIEVVPLEE